MSIIAGYNRGADECPVTRICRVEALRVLSAGVGDQSSALISYELKDRPTSVRMFVEVSPRALWSSSMDLADKVARRPRSVLEEARAESRRFISTQCKVDCHLR